MVPGGTTIATFPTGSIQYHLLTWFYHLPCYVHGTASANISHSIGPICSVYNFDKYNILHRPDEAMLLSWWKFACPWKYFLLFRIFESFVLLINRYSSLVAFQVGCDWWVLVFLTSVTPDHSWKSTIVQISFTFFSFLVIEITLMCLL